MAKKTTKRTLKYQIINKEGEIPEVGTLSNHKDTIIAKQVSDTEAQIYLTDRLGKVLGVKSGGSDNINDILEKSNEITSVDNVKLKEVYFQYLKGSNHFNTGLATFSKFEDTPNQTYNLFVGTSAPTAEQSIHFSVAVGAWTLKNLSKEEGIKSQYITAVGTQSLYNLVKGNNVTALGYQAGSGVKSAGNSVFVGSYAGVFFNREKIDVSDIANISPVAVLVKSDSSKEVKDFYKNNFGITETEVPAVFGSTLIGNSAGLGQEVDRSYFSIHIGSRMETYNYKWRDYNNIIIGNDISTTHANSQIFNSVIIGNFLDTWKPNTTDNILAIHNCKTRRETITNGLIYGEFEGRKLNINGALKLNPTYAPQIDDTFNKVAVANGKGDISFKDLSSLAGNSPIKEEIVENGTLAFFRDRLKTTILKQGDLLHFEFKFTDMNSLSDVDTSQKAYIGDLPSSITLTEDKMICTSFGELHLEADGGRMHIVMYNTSMGDNYSVTAFTIL